MASQFSQHHLLNRKSFPVVCFVRFVKDQMVVDNTIKKWAKDMNRHFSKEDIDEANKHMKKFSSSLVIREMQIKTTLRYHLMPVRMTIIKKSGDNRYWRGWGKTGMLLTLLVGV